MQSGFSLITAIFLLVILASLSAFIVTVSGVQQTSSALDVQGSRAYQAAHAGIEWASYQVLINGCAGYLYERSVTIDHTKVPNTDQINFPMLFSGTYSYLATVANSGKVTNASGFDIIFTDSAGAKLDHEIESYNAATGAVNFWVRVPTVSHTTTDTVIYLCYGNAAITTSQENKTGVWNANYKGVWHLKEDPSGAAPQMKDSTSNANHGTADATMTSADQVPGKIAGSLQFVINERVNFGSGSSLNITGDLTTTFWAKMNSVFDFVDVIRRFSSSDRTYWVYFNLASQFALSRTYNGDATYTDLGKILTTVADGVFHHWAVTTSFADSSIKFYRDGILIGTATIPAGKTSAISTPAASTEVGDTDGVLDEVRVSNIARSADWITTEYNNQSSPSTFYTLGAENAGSAFATACQATACTTPPTCPGPGTPQPLTGMGGTLSGFTTNVDCCSSTQVEGVVTVQVYQICSTAAQGTAATIDRVERQLQATVSK